MDYFAALPAEDLAGELIKRVDGYYNWVMTSGRLARWRVAYDTYYGQRGTHNSSFVSAGGEKGELSFLMSNEYRNLVSHVLVMAQQSRPSLETVAINTDAASKAQAYVAKGLIEYYRRDGKIDTNTYAASEIAMIMDTGWVFNEWDVTRGEGEAADPETGEILRQGDVYTRARTPLDVVVDYTKLDGTDRDWVIVRDPKNKFDLAAQYPEQAEEIKGLQRDMTKDAMFKFGEMSGIEGGDSPDIDVYTFYHRRTPALPKGRMFQFATSKNFFFDGPIPYRKLPGNRICPSEMILSPLGYSSMNDLLGLQDVLDALISAAVTNMTTCGVNNLWVPDPANIDFEQLAAGMNVFGGDKKPEVVELNKLAPEWFNLANFIIGRLEAYSGINSVARGNTGGKDLSGAAMALLQSMSIQFNSGIVRAVNKLTEDNGNDVIMLLQDFAPTERLGMIIGKNNSYQMKYFKGADLDKIQRVFCRQSNPLKDTTAGKLTIAQDLLKIPGAIKSPRDYAEILDTGNLDSLTEPDRNDRLAIDEENEAMMRGEVPPVVFFDFHPEHILGHRKIFASPEDRKDQALLQRVREHIQQHISVWQTTDPNLLQSLGIPPMVAPMPVPPPAGNGPVQPGMEGGAAPSQPPEEQQAPMPGMEAVPGGPNPPTNPLSGESWNPETGGLPPAQ